MKPIVNPCRAALALLCPFLVSAALAVDFTYDFTAGNRTPSATGEAGGVTLSDFSVGALNISENNPDAIRIYGQNLGTSTPTAISSNRQLAFTVTIPAGTTVNFKSLFVSFETNYTGEAVTNARVFTEIQGDDNAGGDTVGVVGKTQSESPPQTSDTLNLENPTLNAGKGANIRANDFLNLTGRTVTFRFPWLSSLNDTTNYIDIKRVTFSYDVVSAPPPVVPLRVTDFRVETDHSSIIDFTGPEGGPFSLMACSDLTGPVYRKRWELLTSGTFEADAISYSDSAAGDNPRRFYVVAGSERPVAKIMPVGDSITAGGGNFVVYRPGLYDQLTAAGYHFEFVGSNGTAPLKHEGVGGDDPTLVASRLAGVFPNNPADIVIIHSGHNMNKTELVLDAAGTQAIVNTVETATRLMITTCRTTNPKVRIILSKVIPAGKMPKYSYIPALNIRLGEIAAELDTPAQPVIIVDQESGFVWQTDTISSDLVHPNEFGAAKMAAKYFSALVPLLE